MYMYMYILYAYSWLYISHYFIYSPLFHLDCWVYHHDPISHHIHIIVSPFFAKSSLLARCPSSRGAKGPGCRRSPSDWNSFDSCGIWKENWKITIFQGNNHYKWWFSIVMFRLGWLSLFMVIDISSDYIMVTFHGWKWKTDISNVWNCNYTIFGEYYGEIVISPAISCLKMGYNHNFE